MRALHDMAMGVPRRGKCFEAEAIDLEARLYIHVVGQMRHRICCATVHLCARVCVICEKVPRR